MQPPLRNICRSDRLDSSLGRRIGSQFVCENSRCGGVRKYSGIVRAHWYVLCVDEQTSPHLHAVGLLAVGSALDFKAAESLTNITASAAASPFVH